MDAVYKYPVFFECPTLKLENEHKKRIESYFHVRRKSGGGECGPLKNINNNIYTIVFRDQIDQERVLEKLEHMLELSDGPLVLRVQKNPPSVDSPSTSSTAQTSEQAGNVSTSKQEEQPKHASSDPEHKLQVENYLLHYLKECPRAAKELQQALSPLAVSWALQPDEGLMIVRGSAQISSVSNGVREWEEKVENVFKEIKARYVCHFECDPQKVKLLQSCNSNQGTENIRVYSDIGMAIVVGENAHVKARLGDVVDLCAKVQGSGIRQNETTSTIRRLGEGKLRLLWEEIKHGLGKYTPDVKVTQGDAGQLVLEGSVGEVIKATDWVTEKEKTVIERVFADASPYLLAFLRKMYGSHGMLGVLLGLGEQVQIELGDTELRMFSLSPGKLNEMEKAFLHEFKDIKVEVPHSTGDVKVNELSLKLESKANEMCKTKHKAEVRFGQMNTINLLGHKQGVEELNDEISQFVLDQTTRQELVFLHLPGIAEHLADILRMHGFDLLEVSIHPNASSSRPSVLLSGPSNQLPRFRNKMGLFLDTLLQDTVAINQPGALRYFQSLPGREKIQRVGSSQKCIVQLQDGSHPGGASLPFSTGASQGVATVASYRCDGGMRVAVCEGDITQVHADALVNAANEDLQHCGGVAAALSQAGGPQVDEESRVMVRNIGNLQTGDVVVTTGGNLHCKKLLHAVGPMQGNEGGRERALLEKTVQSALDLAEVMEFQSIAIPCISSGIYGVPVSVCSEAMVSAVWEFGRQKPKLCEVILIDNRKEVVRSFCNALDRRLKRVDVGDRAGKPSGSPQGFSTAAPDPVMHGNCVQVEIVQGHIEKQKVDVLVSPMVGHDPVSTRVGHALSALFGPQLTTEFNKAAPMMSLAGDITLVKGPSSPGRVMFLNLIPWVDTHSPTAIQALRKGVRCILTSCENNGFRSVAIPALGTGAALRFPHEKAAMALMEEISAHERSRAGGAPLLVRIIIHPYDKDSSKAFQSAQTALHLKGFTNQHPNQTSFYRHVSSSKDRVTAKMGEVELNVVYGNIVHQSVDVIVNTTDFRRHDSGVSKAILTAAGPSVQAQLLQAGIPSDGMCTTRPGALGCKEIIHAAFNCDEQCISKNCGKILRRCESKFYKSVAFPAVNTGAGGMDPATACKAMLDGIATAVTLVNPKVLSHISIVMLQQAVFQAFRSELNNRIGQTAPNLSITEKAKHAFNQIQNIMSRTSKPVQSLGVRPPPALFDVVGRGPGAIEAVKSDLEAIVKQQLIQREIDWKDLSKLDDVELDALQEKAREMGVSLEPKGGEPDGNSSGSKDKVVLVMLQGLKEDVLIVKELIDKAVKKVLQRDLEDNKKAMLAQTVQWFLQDPQEDWQKLNVDDNYLLEQAHRNRGVFVKIEANGMKLKVNLTKEEATDEQTGHTYRVKREEAKTDALNLPVYWEPMAAERFKKVELQPTSKEYMEVSQDFMKTAQQSVIQKIERVQNIQLWKAYALHRQSIREKNGDSHVGERRLYHGTAEESTHCIEQIKFDRGFAGQHTALYGRGVYFAVNASYSVRYSPADQSGLKRMYVARVLTGHYTVGTQDMRVPPPRSTSDPTDCYDTLVDNQQTPSMFVVFHDDQAYPEYLITFS